MYSSLCRAFSPCAEIRIRRVQKVQIYIEELGYIWTFNFVPTSTCRLATTYKHIHTSISFPKLPNIPHNLQQVTLNPPPPRSQIKTSTDSHRPHTDRRLPSARTRRKSRTSKDSAIKVYGTGRITDAKQQNKDFQQKARYFRIKRAGAG